MRKARHNSPIPAQKKSPGWANHTGAGKFLELVNCVHEVGDTLELGNPIRTKLMGERSPERLALEAHAAILRRQILPNEMRQRWCRPRLFHDCLMDSIHSFVIRHED